MMSEVDTITLLGRVKRLEQQNKQIKLSGIVVVLGIAFVLCCGVKNKVPKEIVAESFRMVDTQGQTRGRFSIEQIPGTEEKGSGLGLFDKNGKKGAMFFVSQEYTGLGFLGKNENVQILLSVDPINRGLFVWDENEKLRIGIGIAKTGPGLDIFDKYGKSEFSAP